MDVDELIALGLYDPTDVHADLRLELLDYLVALGATTDELLAYREMLPGLAGMLAIRGGPAIGLNEVAQRTGLDPDDIRRLVRAAGFAEPEPTARIFTEGFVTLAEGTDAIAAVFGEEAFYQLIRVLGSAMARVADAVVSAFLVNVEPVARREDPIGLGVARANADAAALLPLVAPALDVLFRQHLLAAQRTALADDDLAYETQRLVVAFVDLVGSTELGERLSMQDLGSVLTDFEHISSDTVTGGGGRVVKLIGDEVMFIAPDARSACMVALDLAEAFRDHPVVPPVRVGLASGRVMLRDGDVFGPVVNLAARVIKLAQPGEVITTTEVAADAGMFFQPLGRHQLKGVTRGVELVRLTPG